MNLYLVRYFKNDSFCKWNARIKKGNKKDIKTDALWSIKVQKKKNKHIAFIFYNDITLNNHFPILFIYNDSSDLRLMLCISRIYHVLYEFF